MRTLDPNRPLTLRAVGIFATVIASSFLIVYFLSDKAFFSRADGLLLSQRLESISKTVEGVNSSVEKVNDQVNDLTRDQQKTAMILENATQKLDSVANILDGVQGELKGRTSLFKDILDAQVELTKAITELRKKP